MLLNASLSSFKILLLIRKKWLTTKSIKKQVCLLLLLHKNLSFLKAAHFPGHCQWAAGVFVVPAPPLVVDLVMVGGGGAQWWWMWRNLADQSTPHLRQD